MKKKKLSSKRICILIILCVLLLAAVTASAILLYYGMTEISDAYDLEAEDSLRIAAGGKKELGTEFIIINQKKAPRVLKKLRRTEIIYTSSDENIASVDKNGIVYGKTPGTSTIHIQCDKLEAECIVSVYVPLTGIEFFEKEIELKTGDNGFFQIRPIPENAELPGEIEYSCERTDILYVTKSGYYSVKNSGTADVMASVYYEGKTYTASCGVHVSTPLKKLIMNESEFSLAPGDSFRFKVEYEPANTSDTKETEWSVSDSRLASIDEYGRLIALNTGDLTVYARCHGITAECIVHISQHLISLKLSQTDVTLPRDKTMRVPVSFEPENFTDDRTVIWSSSDTNVADVDEKSGKITAKAPGNAVIKASCAGIDATLNVHVTVPAESISISQEECSAPVGDTVLLFAFINPYDTTESQYVNWSSSDPKVASVSQNGKVECISEGTAIIRASHGAYHAGCVVNVFDPSNDDINIPQHEEGTFDGKIFIGDSRFVGMEKSVTLSPGERMICKGGEYYTWFASDALTELRSILAADPYYQVIINMGLNDCANNCAGWTAYYVNNYIDLINQLILQYPKTKFYFASIGYTDGLYGGSRRTYTPEELSTYIDIFNGMMETQCHAEFIDLAKFITDNAIRTADGVHYDTGANLMIYRYLTEITDAEKENAKK